MFKTLLQLKKKTHLFESGWLHLSRYRLLQQSHTSPVFPTPGLGSDRWVGPPFSQSPAQETVRQLIGNISRQEVGWGMRGSPPITRCLSSRQEDPGQQILKTNLHHMLPTYRLKTLGRKLECQSPCFLYALCLESKRIQQNSWIWQWKGN